MLDISYSFEKVADTEVLQRPLEVWDDYNCIGSILGSGDFPCRIDIFFRVGPHDLGIQIDIVGAFLLCHLTLGRWPCERGKNGKPCWGMTRDRFGVQVGVLGILRPGIARKSGCAPGGAIPGPKTGK